MRENRQHFICPECGNTHPGNVVTVKPDFDADKPGTEVMEWIQCNQCGAYVPAHIAERWDDLSEEEARQEWHQKYRNVFELE